MICFTLNFIQLFTQTGPLDPWTPGFLDPWIPGPLDPWTPGPLDPWTKFES